MPQATDEVRAPWHWAEEGGDIAAWKYLKSMGWTETKWVLTVRKRRDDVTDKEWSAVDYLCDEWDWAYEGRAA